FCALRSLRMALVVGQPHVLPRQSILDALLPSVSLSTEGNYTDPYYYVYGYEGSNVSEAKATINYQTYGVLYNWPAALTACPDGWHLPTDAERPSLSLSLLSFIFLDFSGLFVYFRR
ncbi:MAG: hypothetical protein KFF49_03335, partial [Bacteroidales bacterium]|nr:hypothetical protein [Bacteroidales bacterium]